MPVLQEEVFLVSGVGLRVAVAPFVAEVNHPGGDFRHWIQFILRLLPGLPDIGIVDLEIVVEADLLHLSVVEDIERIDTAAVGVSADIAVRIAIPDVAESRVEVPEPFGRIGRCVVVGQHGAVLVDQYIMVQELVPRSGQVRCEHKVVHRVPDTGPGDLRHAVVASRETGRVEPESVKGPDHAQRQGRRQAVRIEGTDGHLPRTVQVLAAPFHAVPAPERNHVAALILQVIRLQDADVAAIPGKEILAYFPGYPPFGERCRPGLQVIAGAERQQQRGDGQGNSISYKSFHCLFIIGAAKVLNKRTGCIENGRKRGNPRPCGGGLHRNRPKTEPGARRRGGRP